jgi:hypothetical protein
VATTQCLRVAQWIPTNAPETGDAIQVVTPSPLVTRFIEIAGGSFPVPTAEGDVMQADAALQWVAIPIDGGTNP